MNLLERVLTLLRANLNTVIEESDDPESVLKQIQLDMRNQLVQVKTEIAKAIAEGHMLQKHGQARKDEADHWLKKAKQAVQQGDDDNARQALRHYNDSNTLIQRYQQQKRDQEQVVSTLRNALRRLEEKITEIDSTLTLLASQKRNALIQQRVHEALSKTGNVGHIQRARDPIARTGIHTSASASKGQNHAASRRMEQSAAFDPEQGIEQQLQELKERSLESPEPTTDVKPLTPHTGPLAHPYGSDTVEQNPDMIKKREKIRNKRNVTSDDISTDRDLDLTYVKKLLDIPQNQE